MDAWCSLWFWPVDHVDSEIEEAAQPPSLDDWLATLEGLLGAAGVKKSAQGQAMFHETIDRFDQLSKVDELERDFFGMRPVWQLVSDNRWLGVARSIAEEQGFFHWELDFAHILRSGGFHVQVGNPPWVRPIWRDDIALAEFDPLFLLQENIPESAFKRRRTEVLTPAPIVSRYLRDLVAWAGIAGHLGSPVEHPVLSGLQTNLYTNFMETTWRHSAPDGVIGLIHEEGHFSDPKAGSLRAQAYRRLRRHWQFVNELTLFEDVHHTRPYGIHIYSAPQPIRFFQMCSVYTPETVDRSLVGDASGEIPGAQYPWGGWDVRPHPSRVTTIDESVLGQWAMLFDPPGTPADEARLLRPLTREHVEVLAVFAAHGHRLSDLGYRWTSFWHEKGAKQDGYIKWDTKYPASWSEVILQGPHFTVATPFAKQPNEFCSSRLDYAAWNLSTLPESVIPRTNYQRACDPKKYENALPRWNDRPATEYWRVVWRRMTHPAAARSLFAALIPPGPAHVDAVHTLMVCGPSDSVVPTVDVSEASPPQDLRNTVLTAGLWASLPFDYLVKISGKPDIRAELVDRFPAPVDHPGWPTMLLRALRLNCLTADYARLWDALYRAAFSRDAWTTPFNAYLPRLGPSGSAWDMSTPLRTDFERRAALVEIDALAALMLGLTADHLALMFRAQFPVLRKYEYSTYFDSQGRKIAKDHQAHGVEQQKDDFKLLEAYLEGGDSGDLLGRYTPFPPDDSHAEPWFYKPDREAEMRAAYADFEQRLTST